MGNMLDLSAHKGLLRYDKIQQDHCPVLDMLKT